MGIIADIVEVLEKQKKDENGATPETVIALAVRKGIQAQQGENSRKDGEKER